MSVESVKTAHDHSEDQTFAEVRESAYRRGFDQAVEMIFDVLEDHLPRPYLAEMKQWREKVSDWRYRLEEFEQPRDIVQWPPPLIEGHHNPPRIFRDGLK